MTWTVDDRLRDRIRDLAAAQRGLLTAEQALEMRAVSVDLLRSISRSGELLPLEAGVYLHAAHTSTPETQPLAAYLATSPHQTLFARHDDDSVVVCGAAAASAWGLHGLLQDTVIRSQNTVPRHRRFRELQYETAPIQRTEISYRFAYPTPTLERVLADALQLDGDLEHVAEALQSALWQHSVDLDTLQRMVEQVGSPAMDGPATWRHLVAEVGGFPHHDGYPYPIRPMIGRRALCPRDDLQSIANAIGDDVNELRRQISTARQRRSAPRHSTSGMALAYVDDRWASQVLLNRAQQWEVVLLARAGRPFALLLPTRRSLLRVRPHRANRLRRRGSKRRIGSGSAPDRVGS